MKTVSLSLIVLICLSSSAFACLNKAPLSAIQAYISSTEPVKGVTCEEKPDEECLCFDGIESWEAAEIVDEEIKEENFGEEPRTIKRKVVRNNPEKLAALKAKQDAEKAEVVEKINKRQQLRARIKQFSGNCIDSSNTIAQLKNCIKSALVDLVELQKDQ